MEELSYRSISASSAQYSEASIAAEMGKLKKISLGFAAPAGFLMGFVMQLDSYDNLDAFFKGRGSPSNVPFGVSFIVGLCVAILIYALIYGFGKSAFEKKQSFARQCYIEIDERGARGRMVYHEKRGNVRNPNLVAQIDVREISLIYRQIDNIEAKQSDIFIHVGNSQYSCPNLPNVREIYEILQNNLRAYDKGK